MNQRVAWITSPIIAALGGLALSAAYAPIDRWFFAVIGLLMLFLVQWKSSNRMGFVTGFIFGLFSFFPQHMWLGVVGTDAHWLLSVYLAVWIGAIGAGSAFISRRISTVPAVAVIAGLWVLEEALRGRYPFGGYPWARVVFSQVEGPFAQWAAIAGVPFVTAIVVACSASIAILVRDRSPTHLAFAVSVLGLSILVPYLYSPSTASEGTFTIGVIQGGTPQTGLGALDVRRAVISNHVRETMELALDIDRGLVDKPELILWPENSSDLNPFSDEQAAVAISTAASSIQTPILVGAVVDSFDNPETEVYNMGILWDPVTGPGDTYIKNAPVPFGEFIPFRSLLTRFIERYDRVPRDFAHGQEAGIFTINDVVLGDLICFEVAVDRVVNEVVKQGAEVILVQTNNATYANTALPQQQLDIERMRAIEMNRAVVVAATTGISASIEPDGTVTQILNDGEVGSFVYSAPIIRDRTLGSIIGPTVEIVMALFALVVLIGIPLVSKCRRKS